MATKTAWQILQEAPLKTLSFGCKVIDSSIGRFPCRGICEVSGEAGAGKTQIALTLAIQAILSDDYSQVEGEAAYITCGEGLFPVRRLSQIAQSYENLEKGISVKDILSRVHIEECMNFEDVAEAVKSKIPEMCRSTRINLLIIDR
jgi:DNA-repair protein XRCC3